MIVIESLDQIGAAERGSVGALGNFDGVIAATAVTTYPRDRRSAGAPVSVITRAVSTQPVPGRRARLTDAAGRAEALAELGVDILFKPFDQTFSLLSAEDFIDQIMHHGLGLRHVVIDMTSIRAAPTRHAGDDVRARRRPWFWRHPGDAVHEADGAIYSSTRIRQCLSEATRAAPSQRATVEFRSGGRERRPTWPPIRLSNRQSAH